MIYLGDGLEVIGHVAVTLWGRDCMWLVLQSPETQLFKSVELYLGDGFKVAG